MQNIGFPSTGIESESQEKNSVFFGGEILAPNFWWQNFGTEILAPKIWRQNCGGKNSPPKIRPQNFATKN